jgi:hypothetical protein
LIRFLAFCSSYTGFLFAPLPNIQNLWFAMERPVITFLKAHETGIRRLGNLSTIADIEQLYDDRRPKTRYSQLGGLLSVFYPNSPQALSIDRRNQFGVQRIHRVLSPPIFVHEEFHFNSISQNADLEPIFGWYCLERNKRLAHGLAVALSGVTIEKLLRVPMLLCAGWRPLAHPQFVARTQKILAASEFSCGRIDFKTELARSICLILKGELNE